MSISGIYNSAIANTQLNESAFNRTQSSQSSGSSTFELPSDVATFQSLIGGSTTSPVSGTLTPVQLAYQSFQQLSGSTSGTPGFHVVTNDPRAIGPTTISPTGVDPKTNDPKAIGPTSISPTGIDPKTNDPKIIGTAAPNQPDGIDPKSNDPRAIGPTTVLPTGLDGIDPVTNDPTALGITALQLPELS